MKAMLMRGMSLEMMERAAKDTVSILAVKAASS
jgi:hypothetical protein